MIDTSSKPKFKEMTKGQKLPYGLIKGMQKYIKKEMDQVAQNSFEQVIGMIDDFEPDNSHVTHENYECDGCGVFPIIGTRYKCSVCKNFDFCSRCEEFVPHDHAFLKLVNPNIQPTVILTAVNED